MLWVSGVGGAVGVVDDDDAVTVQAKQMETKVNATTILCCGAKAAIKV